MCLLYCYYQVLKTQKSFGNATMPEAFKLGKAGRNPLDQCVLHDQPAMAERPRLECCCEVGRIEKTRLQAPSCSQATGEMKRWERERPMLANEWETALSHAMRVLFKTLKLVCAKCCQFKKTLN